MLEAAINGEADALVTFNRHDFGQAPARFGIALLSPQEERAARGCVNGGSLSWVGRRRVSGNDAPGCWWPGATGVNNVADSTSLRSRLAPRTLVGFKGREGAPIEPASRSGASPSPPSVLPWEPAPRCSSPGCCGA